MHGDEREKNAQELAILQRLRDWCASLAEVTEAVDGHGHTSFRVAKKPFVLMGSRELHLAIKSDPMTQQVLVRTRSFKRTPFIGQHGWVSVTDFSRVDWAEIEELVRDAYRLAGPRRLRRPDTV